MSQDSTADHDILPIQEVSVTGSIDWFLQSTIESIIGRGVEIGVTLTVGGAIISGMLISGQTYFKELGDTLTAASREEGDMHSILGEAWKEYTAIYEKPEDAAEDWTPPPAGYIHLREARFFSPSQRAIPDKGILWRGKLSSIDAFSIGNLS
jgi:hypothetical protein